MNDYPSTRNRKKLSKIQNQNTENFNAEGGKTLVQVAQRGSGCPIPGNSQHHGWGSKRPDQVGLDEL